MISEILSRSTAFTGVFLAGAFALGGCQTLSDLGDAEGAEDTAVETASADDADVAAAAAADTGDADIIATASAAGSFDTLVRTLEAAGLSETLRGDGPFTVFAPTDEAFAALPAGTVDALLLPDNRARLTQILSYHVVAGQELTAADLAGQTTTLITMEGRALTVSGASGIKVDDATVIASDVDASNGIIQVIDTVLIP